MDILQYPYIHVLIPILIGTFINANVNIHMNPRVSNNRFLPPGHVIGMIWIILFGLLGYTNYILYKEQKIVGYCFIILLLFIYISYPYITREYTDIKNIDFMNRVTLIITFFISIYIFQISKNAFNFMIPVLLWIMYINLIV
jgi:tryptophan-rich sensory protein